MGAQNPRHSAQNDSDVALCSEAWPRLHSSYAPQKSSYLFLLKSSARHSATKYSNSVIISAIRYTKYMLEGAFCLVWRCSTRYGDFFLGLATLLMNVVSVAFACRI